MQQHATPDWVDETLAHLPSLVTVEEAIAALRTTRRNFYRYIAAGLIKTIRRVDGGSSRHLIARSELARYLRSLDVSAAPVPAPRRARKAGAA